MSPAEGLSAVPTGGLQLWLLPPPVQVGREPVAWGVRAREAEETAWTGPARRYVTTTGAFDTLARAAHGGDTASVLDLPREESGWRHVITALAHPWRDRAADLANALQQRSGDHDPLVSRQVIHQARSLVAWCDTACTGPWLMVWTRAADFPAAALAHTGR